MTSMKSKWVVACFSLQRAFVEHFPKHPAPSRFNATIADIVTKRVQECFDGRLNMSHLEDANSSSRTVEEETLVYMQEYHSNVSVQVRRVVRTRLLFVFGPLSRPGTFFLCSALQKS